ncbi:hypothetical protein ABE488_00735 [Luteimonas sp. TWI662]|uniref:hypothetical protein n=1 Tax=Luteimonas sp. TWI662 TaxID=3136789 RepID=UPI003208BA41
MRMIKLTNTALEVGTSPFFTGGEAIVHNPTGGSLIVQGSLDGTGTGDGAWSTLATVPAGDMLQIEELPPFIRVSTAATVNVLAG